MLHVVSINAQRSLSVITKRAGVSAFLSFFLSFFLFFFFLVFKFFI